MVTLVSNGLCCGDIDTGKLMCTMLLQDATPLKGDRMVVQWMKDVVDIAELRRLSDGALLATLTESIPGTMSGIYTEPKRASTEFWFSKETYLEPPAIYRCESGTVTSDTPPSGVPLPPLPSLFPSLWFPVY